MALDVVRGLVPYLQPACEQGRFIIAGILANRKNWFNYLVCRTGNAASNIAICQAAQRKGWKWNPYGPGFTNDTGGITHVLEERHAFELVGLKYLEPWERNL